MIFAEKNANSDSEVIHQTQVVFFFPFKLKPHQQVFTFIGLQVSLQVLEEE